MNIFVIDPDPKLSAEYIADDPKRSGKMILESVQLLSTVAAEFGLSAPYKSTHKNHPCTFWLKSSQSNYEWLYDYAEYLGILWAARHKNKPHASALHLKQLPMFIELLPNLGLTPFAKVVPEKFKHLDVFEAYKQTLAEKWTKDKILKHNLLIK